MPYDPGLAQRLQEVLLDYPNMVETKMFGGICYMLNGNMCVGVHKDTLIVRIGEKQAEKVLQEPHVGPMDLTGKAMKGWATIQPKAIEDDAHLHRFCKLAIAFVKTLPQK
ncbi:MAG: TfoX/Sxy family protein [Myxococcota bacterium]